MLAWYDHHRRILPWRAAAGVAADPYRVWLSEIMLQQTTVATVGPYFRKFVKRWPSVKQLAKASLDDVLREWAGLGYYRRARGLHDCARRVVADYGGVFPDNEAELLKLPGFGPYTAAAVAAIAFDHRANVVDGNVERVIARVFAIEEPLPQARKTLRAKAETLLPAARYGDYAQALMDLGATICTPRRPKCILCPWQSGCAAFKAGIAGQLPRRTKKAAKPLRRALAFVLFNRRGEILLRQRPPNGLLGGMMEIPTSAWLAQDTPDLAAVSDQAPVAGITWQTLPGHVTHVFTHFIFEVTVAIGHTAKPAKGTWIAPNRLKAEALPSLMHKIAGMAVKTQL